MGGDTLHGDTQHMHWKWLSAVGETKLKKTQLHMKGVCMVIKRVCVYKEL